MEITPKEIRIEIPEFIQEMKLSEAKRTLSYKPGDILPAKYDNKTYGFKKGKLYNLKTGKLVVRNAASAGKPRLKAIAGNDIWGRVHPRVRMAMIDAIRDNFQQYLPAKIDLKFPIQVEMEVHTPCRYCNWDIGNMWVYDKVFQDMLTPKRHEGVVVGPGLIPDDNILYITKAGGPRFIPVVGDANRKMVFILREETDPRVLSHVMYDLHRVKPVQFHRVNEEYRQARHTASHPLFTIEPTTQGVNGSIMVNHDEGKILLSTGKSKLIPSAAKKAFMRAFSTLVQLDAYAHVTLRTWVDYQSYIEKELVQKGLTLHVYG